MVAPPHSRQRQAILNAIVAHEVLNAPDLAAIYRQAAPDALLTGGRLAEVSQAKHGHPKYCLKMATGTGKTWVMQALLVWSLLDRTAAQAEGIDDPRFTRQWDPVREIWVQHGEHRVAALGGAIVAQPTGWITETAGPVHFALTVAGHAIVDARLARVGNRGDHGVPAWSADYSLTASA